MTVEDVEDQQNESTVDIESQDANTGVNITLKV